MRSLYLRIYLTVVAALALFALVSGWLVQRHLDQERVRFEAAQRDRTEAWADLLQRSLPGPDAPPEQAGGAVRDWSQRLRLPMALDDAQGRRMATSESFARREAEPGPMFARRMQPVRLDDGRTLWVLRPGCAPAGAPRPDERRTAVRQPAALVGAAGLARRRQPGAAAGVLFAAVALGAWPVVRRLTRRLEALKQGVEAFGAGALHQPWPRTAVTRWPPWRQLQPRRGAHRGAAAVAQEPAGQCQP
jgi:hypothetical protein